MRRRPKARLTGLGAMTSMFTRAGRTTRVGAVVDARGTGIAAAKPHVGERGAAEGAGPISGTRPRADETSLQVGRPGDTVRTRAGRPQAAEVRFDTDASGGACRRSGGVLKSRAAPRDAWTPRGKPLRSR